MMLIVYIFLNSLLSVLSVTTMKNCSTDLQGIFTNMKTPYLVKFTSADYQVMKCFHGTECQIDYSLSTAYVGNLTKHAQGQIAMILAYVIIY